MHNVAAHCLASFRSRCGEVFATGLLTKWWTLQAVAIHHLRHLADHRRVGGAAQRGAGLRTRLERSAKCLRAAVLDLDVHFGDGTAWQFYDDASVLTVSVHLDQSEAGQFPYLKGNARERGDGDGRGTWVWAGSIGVVGWCGSYLASLAT